MELPVKYKGTECVKKPPAATTQRLWSRRTRSLALSGVSKFDPLAFFTGANSSSRNTWILGQPIFSKYKGSILDKQQKDKKVNCWNYSENQKNKVTSKSAVEGAYGNASKINCSNFDPIVCPCIEGIFFSARW